MTLEDLEKLKKIASEDLKITEDNLAKKSLDIPILYHKYLDIFINELKQLKQLSLDKDKLYGKLYHHYKFESNYSLDTKNEIEVYVKGNDEYYIKALAYYQQEIVVKYLESILDAFTKMGFNIKNHIEFKKFLAGN
ncbi:MAG: recombination mediator protein UvsY [Candidatus Woesearchaeota archaeon]